MTTVLTLLWPAERVCVYGDPGREAAAEGGDLLWDMGTRGGGSGLRTGGGSVRGRGFIGRGTGVWKGHSKRETCAQRTSRKSEIAIVSSN